MISYSWFNDCSLIGVVMFISSERKMFIFGKSGISWKCIPKQIAIQNLIWCKFSYGPMIKFEKSRSLTENCIHLSSFVSSEETQIVSRQEKWAEKSVNKNIYTESWYTFTPKINTFLFIKVLSRSFLVQKIFSQRLRLCYFSASIMLLKENLRRGSICIARQ